MTAYQQWSEVGTIEGSVSGKGGYKAILPLPVMKLTADIGQIRPTSSPATFSNVQFSSGPRSIGLCDNFISEHCQLTQSFFGTRPRSNTTQKIFSAKWTSKGNRKSREATDRVSYMISHTHIWKCSSGKHCTVCSLPILKFHQNYEIPKVCQYCGKVPISFHNLSSRKHTLPSNIPDICHHLFSLVSKN